MFPWISFYIQGRHGRWPDVLPHSEGNEGFLGSSRPGALSARIWSRIAFLSGKDSLVLNGQLMHGSGNRWWFLTLSCSNALRGMFLWLKCTKIFITLPALKRLFSSWEYKALYRAKTLCHSDCVEVAFLQYITKHCLNWGIYLMVIYWGKNWGKNTYHTDCIA